MSAVLSPKANAVVVHLPNRHFLGVMPHRGVNPASIPGAIAKQSAANEFSANGNLDYHGGPVIHSSAPYLIFWTPPGESMPGSSELLMARYFTDVAADNGKATNVFGINRQFTDAAGFADYRQTFSGSQAIVDTHSYPSNGCTRTAKSYPTCLSDAQLQAEVGRLVGARGLPTGIGPNAPIYFVVTPSTVNVCFASSDCGDNAFCGYHGDFIDRGAEVLYAVTPFFLSDNPSSGAQYAKLCQQDGTGAIQEPSGDLADVAISFMSHEDNEVLTDPLGTGWYDEATGKENGDNCQTAFGPTLGDTATGSLFNQLIDNNPYYTQGEWSNGAVGCEMRPSPGTIAPAFSVPRPGSVPPDATATFDPGSTTGSYPLSSTTWDFGDGTLPAFDFGGSALAPMSHSYRAVGRYTVTLTAVDNRGNLTRRSARVIVGSPPTATFTSSPQHPLKRAFVSFKVTSANDPDARVAVTSYGWSFGDGAAGSGRTARHTYARTGTYTVRLSVTNSLGVTRVISHRLTVLAGMARVRVVRKSRSGATLLVTINGPGRLSVGGKTIRVNRARTVKFRVTRRTPPTLRMRITFVPRNGATESKTVAIRFSR